MSAEIVASTFEVVSNTSGPASLAAWIKGNITNTLASKLLAVVPFTVEQNANVLALMSNNVTLATGTSLSTATFITSATFEVATGGITPLVTWMNAQYAGVTAPSSAATLTSVAGGTSAASVTYYVTVTYVTPYGESAASTEANQVVAAAHQLNVASPAAPTAPTLVTGYNVYISTATGTETLQYSNLPIGTSFTLTAPLTTTGKIAPLASVATKLQGITFLSHKGLSDAKYVSVTMSN